MTELEQQFKIKCMAHDLGLSLSRFSNFQLIKEMVWLNYLAK